MSLRRNAGMLSAFAMTASAFAVLPVGSVVAAPATLRRLRRRVRDR